MSGKHGAGMLSCCQNRSTVLISCGEWPWNRRSTKYLLHIDFVPIAKNQNSLWIGLSTSHLLHSFLKCRYTFFKSTSLQTSAMVQRKAENLQLEEAADRPPPPDWVGPQQLERAPVQAGEGARHLEWFVDCMLKYKGYWGTSLNMAT